MYKKGNDVPKKSYIVFFTSMISLLSLFGILLFFMPQRQFSENENRYLTTIQPVSVAGFLDTSVQKNLSNSANDQFYGRDFWMKFATMIQRIVGFKDVGGVYFGKDGYYFERLLDSQISKSRYRNNLNYIEQLAMLSPAKVTFLPIPSAGIILSDKLPAQIMYNAEELYTLASIQLQKTALLDIRPLLSEKKEDRQLYFKTDHHWTMEGAYLGYYAWCKAHGQANIKPLDLFKPKQVSNTFYGTLYSKAPDFFVKPDILTIPVNLPKQRILIDGEKTNHIYHWAKLKTKDKYGVYFGGNFGEISIQSTDNRDKKNLLIIKDSFANSMVPFLLEEYETITMLDLRYFNDSVSNFIRLKHPDEVLILYELSNFSQDINLFKILK